MEGPDPKYLVQLTLITRKRIITTPNQHMKRHRVDTYVLARATSVHKIGYTQTGNICEGYMRDFGNSDEISHISLINPPNSGDLRGIYEGFRHFG